MPVPLNAMVEVARCYFSKVLGYHTDTSIPVKPSGVKSPTPMDIDIICTHPKSDTVPLLAFGLKLPRYVLVECKGWVDVSSAASSILNHINSDLELMGMESSYLSI